MAAAEHERERTGDSPNHGLVRRVIPDTVLWWWHRVFYGWGPRFASRVRKRWILVKHPFADIRLEEPVYLGAGFSLQIPYRGKFHAGPRCDFRRGFRAEIAEGGELVIGAGSVFTDNVLIQCTTRIEIGERCMFGQSTAVFDGNHRFRDLDKPMLEQGYDYKPITIEDDVTTTTKCTIIANIGTRAFVGANTVIVKDVPAYSLVVGNPARVVEYYGPGAGPERPGSGEPAEPSTETAA